MQPIDFAVLTLAALCVFYLPFLTGQLVVKLLFSRRRPAPSSTPTPTPTDVVLDLTDRAHVDRAPSPVATAPVPVVTDSGKELACESAALAGSHVPDVDGLIRYLTDEPGGDAEAFLASFLDEATAATASAIDAAEGVGP